ncbi:MAG: phosphatase PAP2 family protein [Trueperaceae bacterium]|nr:phosphatase PAP2 family protein [Trueperaceae bacterium]
MAKQENRFLKMIRSLPTGWMLLYYSLLLASLFAFAELAEGIYRVQGFRFDSVILNWFFQAQSPALTRLALLLDKLGISYFLGFIITTLALLNLRKSLRSFFFLLLGFWGAVGVNLISKGFFERLRPDLFEQLTPITNYSFPSGHAMGSWAFWLCLMVVSRRRYPRVFPYISLGGFVFAALVGISRCYLQVHYPSDVLAAWVLSTAWVLSMAWWYTRGYRHWFPLIKNDDMDT